MWSGGFPEPLTFSLRAARLLAGRADRVRRRPRQPVTRLRAARAGPAGPAARRHRAPPHHRRPPARAGRRLVRRAPAVGAPLVRLPPHAGACRPPDPADHHRLRLPPRGDIVRDFGVARGRPCASCPSGWTPTLFRPRAVPRVPGRIGDGEQRGQPAQGAAGARRGGREAADGAVGRRARRRGAAGRRTVRSTGDRRPGLGDAVRFVSGLPDDELAALLGERTGGRRTQPLRGILAAGHRGDGVRYAAGDHARRVRCPTWSAGTARARTWSTRATPPSWPRRSARCSTTSHAGSGWASRPGPGPRSATPGAPSPPRRPRATSRRWRRCPRGEHPRRRRRPARPAATPSQVAPVAASEEFPTC